MKIDSDFSSFILMDFPKFHRRESSKVFKIMANKGANHLKILQIEVITKMAPSLSCGY